MKRTIILSLLMLCSAAVADAEIYKWTDDKGVVSYTDDFTKIPPKYRRKAQKVEGIPIPNSISQQEEKVLMDELAPPRNVTTPDSGQPVPEPAPEPTLLGDQPVPAPVGDNPIPVPLGAQPTPVQ